MKKVLVIIVTYNGSRWLEKTLTSISPEKGIEAIIIDNGSTDNTTEILKRHSQGVKLVESQKNLGFGQGNNVGLKYALTHGYDYVYLLNQDAWISPDDILRMAEIMDQNLDLGIMSPLQVYADGTRLDEDFAWALPEALTNAAVLGMPFKTFYESNRLLPAAHWLLPIKVIKDAGGFSPAFIHFGEDDNLFQRIRLKGYKAAVASNIKGVHDRGERVKDRAYQFKIYSGGLRYILSDPRLKHFPFKKMAKKVLLNTKRFGFKSFTGLFNVLKDYGKIRKARKASIFPEAFLDS